MQGEAALNDWEASKTLQAVASSVLDERVWAKVEICRTIWQRGFSGSYCGTAPRRAGEEEALEGSQCFERAEASSRLRLGKARAEPRFAGLQARRVWGDPGFSSEGRRGRRCWGELRLIPPGRLGKSPAFLGGFGPKPSKAAGGLGVLFFSSAHKTCCSQDVSVWNSLFLKRLAESRGWV